MSARRRIPNYTKENVAHLKSTFTNLVFPNNKEINKTLETDCYKYLCAWQFWGIENVQFAYLAGWSGMNQSKLCRRKLREILCDPKCVCWLINMGEVQLNWDVDLLKILEESHVTHFYYEGNNTLYKKEMLEAIYENRQKHLMWYTQRSYWTYPNIYNFLIKCWKSPIHSSRKHRREAIANLRENAKAREVALQLQKNADKWNTTEEDNEGTRELIQLITPTSDMLVPSDTSDDEEQTQVERSAVHPSVLDISPDGERTLLLNPRWVELHETAPQNLDVLVDTFVKVNCHVKECGQMVKLDTAYQIMIKHLDDLAVIVQDIENLFQTAFQLSADDSKEARRHRLFIRDDLCLFASPLQLYCMVVAIDRRTSQSPSISENKDAVKEAWTFMVDKYYFVEVEAEKEHWLLVEYRSPEKIQWQAMNSIKPPLDVSQMDHFAVRTLMTSGNSSALVPTFKIKKQRVTKMFIYGLEANQKTVCGFSETGADICGVQVRRLRTAKGKKVPAIVLSKSVSHDHTSITMTFRLPSTVNFSWELIRDKCQTGPLEFLWRYDWSLGGDAGARCIQYENILNL